MVFVEDSLDSSSAPENHENKPQLRVARRKAVSIKIASLDASENSEEEGNERKNRVDGMGRIEGGRKRELRIKLGTGLPFLNNPRRRHPTYRLRLYLDTKAAWLEMENLRRNEGIRELEGQELLQPPSLNFWGLGCAQYPAPLPINMSSYYSPSHPEPGDSPELGFTNLKTARGIETKMVLREEMEQRVEMDEFAGGFSRRRNEVDSGEEELP